jgi:hypothetical protein
MRASRSGAKFECSEALALGLCFAHGSNINSSVESCGKLKASGCCAKCHAAKTGQAERAKFLLRICLIQPARVSAKFGGRSFAGNGTPIHVNCTDLSYNSVRGFFDGPPVAAVAKVVDR